MATLRTLMITQWYPPEPGPAVVPAVIAQALVQRGHEVEVLTGFPNYPTGELQPGWKMSFLQPSELDGVKVWRVPLFASHDASALKRIANYASFGISAAAGVLWGRLRGKIQRPDVQWVAYSPVTVGLPMLVSRAFGRIPTVVWVGDLWPDTMEVAGLNGAHSVLKVAGRLLHWWCNLLYRHAEAVVVLSPGIRDVLIGRGVPEEKIHFIPVAPDERVFRPLSVAERAKARERFGTEGQRRVLLYAGAMGEAQGLSTLIRAAAKAGDQGPEVLLAGSGTQEEALRELATSLNAPVRFLGRVQQEEMSELLGAVDAAFIGLSDAPLSAITMPSKTQSIIASHTPIVCSAPGDVAAVVAKNDIGLVCPPGDVEKLKQCLQTLAAADDAQMASWRANAATLHRQEFAAEKAGAATDALLRQVIAQK
ncbi:glycosyltransferase family 4 protein [Corynebacterium pelargi]|uniref:Mannosylfructose-phosphate synthase n=1 Tax=Corynebacterium pelargi TaxID=1471400 RepID=A0A410W5U5_9CORY|nr:glycosyltransferase family 4 protein [Corynebacterium pelargi]QAU51408.1 Mannosylfructose-phosphate synthase [Corynebacterium pelargi]GGG81138.1 glycosyltransferase WbuB [Corynebacterium pelargi]